MANYQKMYYILCRAVDEALDILPEDAAEVRQVLQRALDQAEEIYIDTAED